MCYTRSRESKPKKETSQKIQPGEKKDKATRMQGFHPGVVEDCGRLKEDLLTALLSDCCKRPVA